MSVSLLAKEVYHAHVAHFGEPAESWAFDDGTKSEVFPDRIDVMWWPADESCDVNTFSTIGMCDRAMIGAAYRAELHFAVRAKLEANEAVNAARFLANLAMYPFQIGAALDWWHTISNPGRIPFFKEASCVLLHPRFVEDGWDAIPSEIAEVRLLNVVPITPAERARQSRQGIAEALESRDIFAPK